ncbi:MAG: hypothetical protein KBF93_10450 [Leptospiraceae bacterium]|nr:hypothetical protein [Leptospiraceae bacterium]
MRFFRYNLCCLICFSLLFSSCAYFTKEPGRPPKVGTVLIADGYRKLYVHNFQNDSYGAAVHTTLTQLVKSEIDRRGRFIHTRDKSLSSFRLYGSVVHYQKVGNIVDAFGQHMSSEISIVVKLEIQESVSGDKITLERDEILARAYYSDQLGNRESEEQAQSRMLQNLAYRISEESENAWYYYVKEKHYKNVKLEKK